VIRRRDRLTLLALVAALAVACPPLRADSEPAPSVTGAPEADLSSVFPDWKAWEGGADELEAAVARFEALGGQSLDSAAELLTALRAEDDVRRGAARVDGYLSLRLALDSTDAEALAHRGRMGAIGARWESRASIWFESRLLALGPDRIAAWLTAEPRLAPYRWRLERVIRTSPKPLSAHDLELLASVDRERASARDVFRALTVTEAPRIHVDLPSGESLEVGPALARNLAAEVADPADRRAVHAAWLKAIAEHAATRAALLAGVVGREGFDARERGFADALEASFAGEGVPAATVHSMLEAARTAGSAVARWHRARKHRLGLDRYGVSDVRVPLGALRTSMPWSVARGELEGALEPLGPDWNALLRDAFDHGWIDGVERPHKSPVGFSTFVYGAHPFVSIAWRGTPTDILRLAHELGHAVHHQLAFRAQPFGPSRPSVLVAETAAAVDELLLARRVAADATTPAERIAALDFEAELIHRSFVDTALDADFEVAVHAAPPGLTADRLADLYRERLVAFHGGALDLDPDDGEGWLEVPHFYTTPFTMARYPLSFAAAARLVEGLTDPDPERAAAARTRYLALLRAGGSEAPLDLLAAAGADLRDPDTVAAVPRRLDALAAAVAAAP
jgi:oligoendopeptidase F